MSSAATWMYLEIVTLTEVSQTEKEKHHVTSLNLKRNDTNALICKAEADSLA